MSSRGAQVKRFLTAVLSESYDLGILLDTMRLAEKLTREEVMRRISYCSALNARGGHVYIRPSRHIEHEYILIDDLNKPRLDCLMREVHPAAVVRTSPGNYQVWLRHTSKLTARERKVIARYATKRWGGDPASADGSHFGRLPGFTNRKEKYVMEDGTYPWVNLEHYSASSKADLYELLDVNEITTHTPPAYGCGRYGASRHFSDEYLEVLYRFFRGRLDKSQSEVDWAFVCTVLSGTEEAKRAEVAEVLRDFLEVKRVDKRNPSYYASRTVSRALDYLTLRQR